jgi:hypothetical protein
LSHVQCNLLLTTKIRSGDDNHVFGDEEQRQQLYMCRCLRTRLPSRCGFPLGMTADRALYMTTGDS